MDDSQKRPSRRDFLKTAGLGSAAALLAACGAAPAPAGNAGAAATTAPAATTGAAAGGAPAADTTATIRIFNFGGDADKKIYADAHARFKQKYPNVTINDNFTPVEGWADYANKLTTQIAGGEVPDIINIAIEGTRLAVSKGLLLPLDDYLAQDAGGQELIADVAEPLINAFKVDGKIWQIPHSWNNMVIYYNTKMFQDAGLEPPREDWTWDDFVATAKTLTTGTGADQVYGFGIPNFYFGWTPWFVTNDTLQLKPDWSDSNLNDPKVLETVTFIHDLIHVHKVSPAVEGTDTAQLFAAGKLAMSAWGHWPIQGFIANNFRDFDVQYYPRKVKAGNVHGVGGWGISPQSENKQLAWELIKELTGKATIEATAEAGVAIPARRSTAEGAEFLKFPENSEIYYGSLEVNSVAVPSPANFNEVEGIFNRHIGEILSAATTPEDGLAAAHTELSAAMARLKS